MPRQRLLLTLALCFLYASLHASEPLAETKMIDRISNPDRSQVSGFQSKAFNPGGVQFDKSLKTGEYSSVKQFSSKPFASKAFEGAKKSWMGKLLFHEKKLPDNLQGANRDTTKQFDSKELTEKNFSDLDKKSGYANREAFATRQIVPKGTTQGAIDNDQHLQEAVKKGLSIDDIRKLLNKGP